MNRLSFVGDNTDFSNNKNRKKNHSGSLSDLSQSDVKPSGPSINREDSILSKSSLTSIFSSKKNNEGSWSNGSIGCIYAPRPDKTMILFERDLQALKEMYDKYYDKTNNDDGIEHQDYNEICTKIDDRMRLIQTFKTGYISLLENKKAEYEKIQSNLRTILSNKNSKQINDLGETDNYWLICRDLFLIENKLEKCTGKLQFQIMDLDSISKLNPLDQYELSIKLNETTKFKTKIKIDKNGHQSWDSRNFEINPNIDDSANIKFSELKALNKSTVLLDIKLPFNDLIKSTPSIFNFWLTPLGTIKLNVIVQWNAQLEDNIDSKTIEYSMKSEVVMRGRPLSYRHGNNKLSTNFENLFRSSRSDNSIITNLMSNINECYEEEKKSKESNIKSSDEVNSSKMQSVKIDIQCEKKNHENSEQSAETKILIEKELTTSESIEEKPKTVLLRQKKINILVHEDNLSNEELTYIIKEDILEDQMNKTNQLNDLTNTDEIIESPIITVTEMAIENMEKDKNEVIIEDNYIVENESLSSLIDTVTNEHSPQKVTNNEIEVEINIDSSEVESIEQSLDDNIKLNNEDNCNVDCLSSLARSKLESYTVDDNVLGSTNDSELIPPECTVSHIVPVEDNTKYNNGNNCNIECLSSPDRSKLENDTIEDNALGSTDDNKLISPECTVPHIVPVEDNTKYNNENNCSIDCLSSLDKSKQESYTVEDNDKSKQESYTVEDNALGSTDNIELIPPECTVPHIVPVEDNTKYNNENNCNIECLSSPDRSKLENDTIEDNRLLNTDDSATMPS